ncbi:hypothetical protein Tco_0953802 [Tanacetum coccineum]|uniref:Uncharacterized protein n=1 Tax=Tanacetum coccineum TaxID=301880 RepID=A0ABQ5E0X0_9ASTR
MENANPFVPAPPNGLHAKITREINELRAISALIDSYLRDVNHTLSNEIDMDDLASSDEQIDTPLISPFLDSDDESDDVEVIDELDEYGNMRNFYPKRIINSLDGEDLAFPLPGRNSVAIVKDVYVFVGSFTYVADFVVLEDIGEFIVSDMADVVMGRPFRAVTQLEYDCVKGFISFNRIFDTYIFRMPRTIPRLRTLTGVIFDEKSLEVLRKFHMTILRGRFNQLSHVSSPLLSKPGEY